MPDVSAEARQSVKREAARTALVDNNLAASCATAAAAVSIFSPPHAAAMGVGSGLFWLLANYRQAVANDPPREDFDEVWTSRAQIDESLVPSDEREAAVFRFEAQQLVVADALYALLRSLERHDGAVAAGNDDAAAAQAEAARANAEASATRQDTLLSLAPSVNQAFDSLRSEFDVNWDAVTLDQVREFYIASVGESPESPGPAVEAVAAAVADGASDLLEPFDTGLEHPVLGPNAEKPPEPQDLIGQEYVDGLFTLSSELRGLVIDPA